MGLPVRFSSAALEGFPHVALTQLSTWNYRAPGWFIHGPVGTGKTHAMAALCRAAARRGLHPRFISAAGFLEARRAAFDGKDGGDILQRLLDADLVAIDDLGNERGGEQITPWAVGELHELIDKLYGAESLLVITANLSLRELAGALGDRLASRIAGLTRPLALGGADRRLEVVK
jgi:DNA replication protein DnaC